MSEARSGGVLAAEALIAHDVDVVFTLSGGHLFPLYDGCVQTDVQLVDVRHEQTAAFAAEGWAKLTRRPGVAALTAGPGVTNGVSAITAAGLNGSALLVIGGRAPHARWGAGSLQELDHIPIVASVTKRATTATETAAIGHEIDQALRVARTPHRGPTFVDIPLDVFFDGAAEAVPAPVDAAAFAGPAPDPDAIDRVAGLLRDAARPVLLVGADAHWAGADATLAPFAEAARVPVFANGLGRGLLPADHPLAFSRVRGSAFKQADLVVVAGAPLDFRLGFGSFGEAQVVHLCDAPESVARHAELAASTAGDLAQAFAALADAVVTTGKKPDHEAWIEELRADENARRAAEADALGNASTPISPTRIYGELRPRLERDAVVIGDGGDFVSYAGKYIDTYEPGCFLDPGPYGCLGMGTGYALAASVARPGRQIVVLFGDGAIGFSLGDLDTLVRFGVDVVAVVGNNGIWGLEKHPMNQVYGYDVVADLRPGTRYDEVAEALGGHGELVEAPDAIGPALDRAFANPGLSVVNVLTDPGEAYPRSSNLA